jgi:hypothetical protein
MDLKARIENHKDELVRAAEDSPFIVFLCGPTLKAGEPKPSAVLRAQLKERLEVNGFEVVLGEDEGLEDARLHLVD